MLKAVRIGLNLDGVIIDHTAHKLALARRFGYELEPWQVNANLIARFVAVEDYERLQAELYGPLTPEAPAVEGALEHLALITGELHIVSARRPETIRYAQAWLNSHRVFDFIPAERIFFCGVNAEKRGIAKQLGLDVFMDDQLRALAALPAGCHPVLFDAHGVADELQLAEGVSIAGGWPDFLQLADRRQGSLL